MNIGPTYLDQFAGKILVRCPDCFGRAELTKRLDRRGNIAGYRFVCPSCCHARQWPKKGANWFPGPAGGPFLPGFELNIWLQTPCCGSTLWAYNLAHVTFLENYVAATLRERRNHQWGWSRNSSLESRLPRWMQVAKNRLSVLKGLTQLRAMLDDRQTTEGLVKSKRRT